MTEPRGVLPKILVILPKEHPIAGHLAEQAFGDVADYRVLPSTHDFAADTSFPDTSIGAIACIGTTPAMVDAMLTVHTPSALW
jgi:hypothetical protein